jgi:hypothetical protein
MSIQDPRKGEGWNFTLDENEPWYKAFETVEEDGERYIDIDHYEEFANMQELVNFVRGQGTYENTRAFVPGEQDIQDKKRQLQNDTWKLPSKMEEIREYLETGAMRGEIDLDPTAKAKWSVSKQEANIRSADTKYTARFLVYDEDNPDSGETVYIETSWYDTEPDQMTVEQLFKSVFEEKKED